MKVAARLRAGWPFSTAFLLRHLTSLGSPSLAPSLSERSFALRLSFSLASSPASISSLPSQFVSRVCAHTPIRWHGAVASALVRPPCRPHPVPSAGSGPRENSCVVSSCRATPPLPRQRALLSPARHVRREHPGAPVLHGGERARARCSAAAARNADAHRRDVNIAAAVTRERLAHLRNRVVHESIN